jgi:hypothetical protein
MTNFSELFKKYNPLKQGLGELDTIVDERAKAIQSGILYERNRILNEVLKLDFDSFDDIVLKRDVLLAIRGPKEDK